MPRFKDYLFIGIDGDQYTLPRVEELTKKEYKGYPLNADQETYGLSMYAVIATELMTGAPIAFEESHYNDEISKACNIVKNSSKKEVYVYDRLYFCEKLIREHTQQDNYFIFRLKRSGIPCVVKDFYMSDKLSMEVDLFGCRVRLIRGSYDKEGNSIVIATNLPQKEFADVEIIEIYQRRWCCETANKDTTVNFKMDHFHARSHNGILQEIYACLWLRLSTAVVLSINHNYAEDFLKKEYKLPNIKRTARNFARYLWDFICGKISKVAEKMSQIIKKSIEIRMRNKGSLDKKIKYNRKKDYGKITFSREK